MKSPILVYPDPNKPYALFMEASKYAWSAVLTQEHTTIIDGKTLVHQHTVTYVSGLFQGSKLNWVALTKEVYAIYMVVKKLSILQVLLSLHEVTIYL